MYNACFITTYNFYDTSLATVNPVSKRVIETNPLLHDESKEELLDMANFIYKNELLSAFGIVEYNNLVINERVKELYKILFTEGALDAYSKQIFTILMKKMAAEFFTEDLESGFIMLFSYSYFHLTHLCLSDFFNNGKIEEQNLQAFYNSVLL